MTMQDLTQEERNALPEGHPWKHFGEFHFGGMDFFTAKEKTVKEYEEKERLDRIRAAKEKLERHYLEKSGVPERYHTESLETFKAYSDDLKKVVETVTRYAGSPSNHTLILCGGNGMGKTHLACGIIRECGGYYLTVQRLLFMAESAMSFKATESKIDMLDRISDAKMLILDEVGRGMQAERQQELVQYILDARYSKMKPTVLVSNLEKAELIKWLGQSVKDRLNETCVFLELKGDSYRIRKRTTGGNDEGKGKAD